MIMNDVSMSANLLGLLLGRLRRHSRRRGRRLVELAASDVSASKPVESTVPSTKAYRPLAGRRGRGLVAGLLSHT